jgi:hypothetical protein
MWKPFVNRSVSASGLDQMVNKGAQIETYVVMQ